MPRSTSTSAGSDKPDRRNCTKEVTDDDAFEQALRGAHDGDKVCLKIGDLGVNVQISKGGGAGLAIQILGMGVLADSGITVNTDGTLNTDHSYDAESSSDHQRKSSTRTPR